MGVIDDIAKQLDRIPLWRRMQEVPSEVDELRKRVVALEELTKGKALAEACPYCGARAQRLAESLQGGQLEIWKCGDCGKVQELRGIEARARRFQARGTS